MNKYEVTFITDGCCLGGEDNETSTNIFEGEQAVVDELLSQASNENIEEGLDEDDGKKYTSIKKGKYNGKAKVKVSFDEAVEFLTELLRNYEVYINVKKAE